MPYTPRDRNLDLATLALGLIAFVILYFANTGPSVSEAGREPAHVDTRRPPDAGPVEIDSICVDVYPSAIDRAPFVTCVPLHGPRNSRLDR